MAQIHYFAISSPPMPPMPNKFATAAVRAQALAHLRAVFGQVADHLVLARAHRERQRVLSVVGVRGGAEEAADAARMHVRPALDEELHHLDVVREDGLVQRRLALVQARPFKQVQALLVRREDEPGAVQVHQVADDGVVLLAICARALGYGHVKHVLAWASAGGEEQERMRMRASGERGDFQHQKRN